MSTEVKDVQKEEVVKEMFKVGAHFGYARSSRHSTTKPYIFGFKNKTAIIDLEKTVELLEVACNFARELGKEKKQIIFVGTKSEAKKPVKEAADAIDMPVVTERWIGGTLTNFKEIRKRIERMEDLKAQGEKGELVKYTKKERGVLAKELSDLERYFSGISNLSKLPAAVFVIDANKEKIAVDEAIKLHIPVISLCSSDCDLDPVNYPIVANDGSQGSISFFAKQIAGAYREGLFAAKEEKAVA